MFENINWLAIAVATLVPLFVGGAWYGKLFGKTWMHAVGMTEADMKTTYNPPLFFGGMLGAGLLAALFLGHFMSDCQLTGAKAFAFGLLDGSVIACATVVPALVCNAVFERRFSLSYVLVNGGYWVVCFGLMAGVLNIWK